MSLTMKEVNILGSIINNTFGKTSIVGNPSTALKCYLSGDNLRVKYQTIINVPRDYRNQTLIETEIDKAMTVCSEYIKVIIKEFNEKSETSINIKPLKQNYNHSLEIIGGFASQNPTAKFVFDANYEVT